eukprot:scaffold54239_cov78-Phaeocystis_antarctica.AAC.3
MTTARPCRVNYAGYAPLESQYAARRLVLVKDKVGPTTKGTGAWWAHGGHRHASPSHDRAVHTGGCFHVKTTFTYAYNWLSQPIDSHKHETPCSRPASFVCCAGAAVRKSLCFCERQSHDNRPSSAREEELKENVSLSCPDSHYQGRASIPRHPAE